MVLFYKVDDDVQCCLRGKLVFNACPVKMLMMILCGKFAVKAFLELVISYGFLSESGS